MMCPGCGAPLKKAGFAAGAEGTTVCGTCGLVVADRKNSHGKPRRRRPRGERSKGCRRPRKGEW